MIASEKTQDERILGEIRGAVVLVGRTVVVLRAADGVAVAVERAADGHGAAGACA